MGKSLPEGYEIRSIDTVGSEDGAYLKVTPYYKGRPISEGKYPGISGYASAVRSAKRAIRIHHKNNIDNQLED